MNCKFNVIEEQLPIFLGKKATRSRVLLHESAGKVRVIATYDRTGSYLIRSPDSKSVIRVDNDLTAPLVYFYASHDYFFSCHAHQDGQLLQLFNAHTEEKSVLVHPNPEDPVKAVFCSSTDALWVTAKAVCSVSLLDFTPSAIQCTEIAPVTFQNVQSKLSTTKDSRLLVVERSDVSLWSFATSSFLLRGHADSVTSSFTFADFHEDTVVGVTTKGMFLWKLDGSRTTSFFPTAIPITALCLSENLIITGDSNGGISLRDVNTDEQAFINKVDESSSESSEQSLHDLLLNRITHIIKFGHLIYSLCAQGQLSVWFTNDRVRAKPRKMTMLKHQILGAGSDRDKILVLLRNADSKNLVLCTSKHKSNTSLSNPLSKVKPKEPVYGPAPLAPDIRGRSRSMTVGASSEDSEEAPLLQLGGRKLARAFKLDRTALSRARDSDQDDGWANTAPSSPTSHRERENIPPTRTSDRATSLDVERELKRSRSFTSAKKQPTSPRQNKLDDLKRSRSFGLDSDQSSEKVEKSPNPENGSKRRRVIRRLALPITIKSHRRSSNGGSESEEDITGNTTESLPSTPTSASRIAPRPRLPSPRALKHRKRASMPAQTRSENPENPNSYTSHSSSISSSNSPITGAKFSKSKHLNLPGSTTTPNSEPRRSQRPSTPVLIRSVTIGGSRERSKSESSSTSEGNLSRSRSEKAKDAREPAVKKNGSSERKISSRSLALNRSTSVVEQPTRITPTKPRVPTPMPTFTTAELSVPLTKSISKGKSYGTVAQSPSTSDEEDNFLGSNSDVDETPPSAFPRAIHTRVPLSASVTATTETKATTTYWSSYQTVDPSAPYFEKPKSHSVSSGTDYYRPASFRRHTRTPKNPRRADMEKSHDETVGKARRSLSKPSPIKGDLRSEKESPRPRTKSSNDAYLLSIADAKNFKDSGLPRFLMRAKSSDDGKLFDKIQKQTKANGQNEQSDALAPEPLPEGSKSRLRKSDSDNAPPERKARTLHRAKTLEGTRDDVPGLATLVQSVRDKRAPSGTATPKATSIDASITPSSTSKSTLRKPSAPILPPLQLDAISKISATTQTSNSPDSTGTSLTPVKAAAKRTTSPRNPRNRGHSFQEESQDRSESPIQSRSEPILPLGQSPPVTPELSTLSTPNKGSGGKSTVPRNPRQQQAKPVIVVSPEDRQVPKSS